MRKLSRLEMVCLTVTLLILAFMAAVMTARKSVWAEKDMNATHDGLVPTTDTASALSPDRLAPDETDEAIFSETNDTAFSEQARHIPNPSSTNLTGTPSPASTNPALSATALGTNEVMLALQRIAAMPWSPAAEKLLQDTLSKWAASDPTAALQYALQIESRRVRANLVSGIFSSWAKSDATAAYTWLMANKDSDPGTFQMGLKPVFTALATSSIDNAMKMAMTISTGPDRMTALRSIVEQASRSGVAPSMVSYMDSLKTPGEQQNFASILAQNWAVYAPQEAAQWALSLTDPVLKKATLSSTMGTWASDNPQAAADWVLALPAGDLKTRQIAQVTQSWARYDPVKAADWLLAQHPPSPSLDPAIQGLVGTVVRSNPEGAIMWASAISDPQLRNSTIVNASREWMKSDPGKASAYIHTAPISPAQRARLLRGR